MRRSIIAVVTALAICGVAVVVLVSRERPEGAPERIDSALTVFHPEVRSDRNGPITMGARGIVAVDPATGSVRRTLVPCPSRCSGGELISIAWSPDGSLLAFVWTCFAGCPSDDYGIYVADPRSGAERLIRPGLGPTAVAWSPDGTRLAYLDGGALRTMAPDGSAIEVVSIPGGHAVAFSWASDGRFAIEDRNDPGIYILDARGGETTMLVGSGSAPSWSPDGRTLAYRAGCEIRLVAPDGPRTSVPLIDLRSRRPSPSIPTPQRCHSHVASPFGSPEAAWSPDGSKLVVLGEDGDYIVVPLDGSRPTRLPIRTNDIYSAVWRPAP